MQPPISEISLLSPADFSRRPAVRAAALRAGALGTFRRRVALLLLGRWDGLLLVGLGFSSLGLFLGLLDLSLAALPRGELLRLLEDRGLLLLGGLCRHLLLGLPVRPVEVDELEDRQLRAVARPTAELQDPRVTARARLETRRDLFEELLDGRSLGDRLQDESARVKPSPLSQSDHLLDERPEVLRLRQRRLDALVGDEGRKLVPEQRLAMRRRPSELPARSIVLHGTLSAPRRPGTRASCRRRGP